MTIVQINAVYGSRSTGVIVQNIHEMLRENGHHSYVIVPHYHSDDRDIVSGGVRLEEKVHAVLTRLFGVQGWASWVETGKYLRHLDRIRPDMIHLHNIHSNFLNYRMLLNYTARHHIPVIMTLHDAWMFTGKCYHFLDIGCQNWRTECKNCPKRYMDIPSMLVDNSRNVFFVRNRLYSRNRVVVVGCSQWISQCASVSPLFQKAEHAYVYNGVDLNLFIDSGNNLREKCGLQKCFVILAMANKLFDKENMATVQKLIESLGEKDRLLILGCKEGQRINHSNVICVGYVSNQEEMAAYYRTADVFLNMTRVDTLPTVNMEAAACGVPVITFDAGGSGELVSEGKSGYVVQPGDADAVLRAIEKVKNQKIYRRNCREWAVQRFDKNENFKKYISLYEAVLTDVSSRRSV